MENIEQECTLTDEELIEKGNDWITRLCNSGGRDWCLSVPVRFNKDPDMIFVEIIKRFKKLKDQQP